MKKYLNTRQSKMLLVATVGLIFSIVILNGCKKDDDPDPAQNDQQFQIVDEYELGSELIEDYFSMLPDEPEMYDYRDLHTDISGLATPPTSANTKFTKVSYTSSDNTGNTISLSGLMIYPPDKIDAGTPLVSFNHGTELEKKYAPSQFDPGHSSLSKFAEVIFAWGMSAFNNWIVIMPDYQGMGDDVNEVHPYCVKDRLAVATADMVEAAKNTLLGQIVPGWSGNTYIIGYSEGGFVTMAALQELENRNYSLNGAICMEGPYDLSGTMLPMMLRDTAFPVPYFLPMLLVGYQTMYPDVFIYNEMLKSPYNTDIPEYADGFHTTDEVNSIMPADKILKEVFTDAFSDSLSNQSSSAFQVLSDNNTYQAWIPQTTTMLWHCENDDCVPFGNFTKVKSVFGNPSNITYTAYPPVYPVLGTVHESAAPIAFLAATTWILQQENQ